MTETDAMKPVQLWGRLSHVGIAAVKEAFTTQDFGDTCEGLACLVCVCVCVCVCLSLCVCAYLSLSLSVPLSLSLQLSLSVLASLSTCRRHTPSHFEQARVRWWLSRIND